MTLYHQGVVEMLRMARSLLVAFWMIIAAFLLLAIATGIGDVRTVFLTHPASQGASR